MVARSHSDRAIFFCIPIQTNHSERLFKVEKESLKFKTYE